MEANKLISFTVNGLVFKTRTKVNLMKASGFHIFHIIPLLRHFTISGQKNAQNMPRYYTVEQGKNTDWKQSDKMAKPNFNF